jgi:hypothetical protein
MSGINDSAKFNSTSSYYVEATPFGGGQIVNGNLQVTGGISAGAGVTVTGPGSFTGTLASGAATITGAAAVSGALSSSSLNVTGPAVVTGTLTSGAISAPSITAPTAAVSGTATVGTLSATQVNSVNENISGTTTTNALTVGGVSNFTGLASFGNINFGIGLSTNSVVAPTVTAAALDGAFTNTTTAVNTLVSASTGRFQIGNTRFVWGYNVGNFAGGTVTVPFPFTFGGFPAAWVCSVNGEVVSCQGQTTALIVATPSAVTPIGFYWLAIGPA